MKTETLLLLGVIGYLVFKDQIDSALFAGSSAIPAPRQKPVYDEANRASGWGGGEVIGYGTARSLPPPVPATIGDCISTYPALGTRCRNPDGVIVTY